MIVQNIGDARVLQVVRYEHATSLQMGGVKSWINFFDGLVSARSFRGLKPGACVADMKVAATTAGYRV